MKSIDKFVLVLVASLALLLAGCGGGSSTTEPVDPGPTPEQIAAAAIMEAKDALTTAEGQLTGATTDADMLAAYQAIHGAAQNLITVLGANGGSTDDIVAATVARQNAAGKIADLTKKIADAADAAAAATLAAMIKEVGTKNTAMDAEGAQTTDGGLGGSVASLITTANAEGSYDLSISRNRMGTTVEVTVNGTTDDDDVKFTSSDVSYGLTKHVRTHDADDDGNVMEETAMVMTDIEAPKATPFAMVANQAFNTNPGGPGNANRSLTIDSTNLAMISGVSQFPSAVNQTAVPFDQNAEFSGMFNGAPGTYTCASTGCTLSTNAEGNLSDIAGTWHFTPNAGATSDVPDATYHHYGFWIKKTTDPDGVVTYNEVETFAGFTGMADNTDTSAAVGTAKYSGGALGVYTHKVLDSEGGSTAVSGGHFTADANLTATFGQVNNAAGVGTIAPNMLNTVTGTIDNFMLAGGEANNWSVSLEGNDSDTNGSIVGTNTDGTVWSAQYYGASTADTNPAAILGEFNAGFPNGQVAGAFGADLE